MPGMLIVARCRDFADVVFKGSRSAACRGCPVTGHLPVDEIYFSIAEASKTCPDLTETTGLAGEEPLKAQNIALASKKQIAAVLRRAQGKGVCRGS